MSRRGCLILGALILLPFLIVGIVRMGRKAARRAKYSSAAGVMAPVDAGAPRDDLGFDQVAVQALMSSIAA